MTDRELLEAAARAAGIKVDWRESVGCYCYSYSPYNIAWNPLDGDGDALRLAMDLGLVVDCSRPSAGPPFYSHSFAQVDGTDPHAATRRAIVRAAAAMGRAKAGGE